MGSKFEETIYEILSREPVTPNEVAKTLGYLTQEMLPPETIKTILNVSAPNTYLMLERTYEAI